MAIRQKTIYTMKMAAACPSHSLANISVRDVTLPIDEPTERGGTNAGPTPTETAVGALLGCTNVIAHKCADKLGIDIGHLDIEASCDFDRRGVMLSEEIEVPFQAITLNIKADGPATAAELEQVRNEVQKFCPLAKLFKNAGATIEENWQAAG